MKLYYRRSKSFDPFRINFSKSRVGVSTGVKGICLSMDPNATYINVSRNGIYYSKKICGSSAIKSNSSVKPTNLLAFNYENTYSFTDATRVSASSGNVSELGNSIIKDIKRAKVFTWMWIILLIALFAVISWWSLLPMLLLRFIFPQFFNAFIKYDLDKDASLKWEKYLEIINILKSSKKIWIVESSKLNLNIKYNAGASRNILRSVARVKRIKPKHNTGFKVKTNITSVVIKSNKYSLLFLPSNIIVKNGVRYTAYSYDQLMVYSSTTNFIESNIVPRDAEIIRYTWQYVNKNGTADKRFNNNRQLPVCRYGLLHFTGWQEISIELHTSNKIVAENVGNIYKHYKSYVNKIGLLSPSTANTQRISRTPVTNSSLQSVYNELNTSVQGTGRNLTADFSQWLSCKVSFIDGQYHYDHPILYYKASKDVFDIIPLLEKTLNEQLEYRVKIDLVSNDSFIAHLDINSELKFSDSEVTLSPVLSEALEGAKRWSATHSTPQNESLQRISDISKAATSVGIPDDNPENKPVTIENDIYSHIFESGGVNDSKDTSLIDDMLMFLEEEQ